MIGLLRDQLNAKDMPVFWGINCLTFGKKKQYTIVSSRVIVLLLSNEVISAMKYASKAQENMLIEYPSPPPQ